VKVAGPSPGDEGFVTCRPGPGHATFQVMTTSALTLSHPRAVLDVLLAGLAGAVAPYLVALGWAAWSAAVWGRGLRLAMFLDPAAALPAGYVAASLLFNIAAGALLGAGLARAAERPGARRWDRWVAFAAGIALSLAWRDARALAQPAVVLFIASSAPAFRLCARR
jgi:hypothetical protein